MSSRLRQVVSIIQSQPNLRLGLRRLAFIVREVWAYDWARPGVITGFQSTTEYFPPDYMWYSPTETTTCRDILTFTKDWLRSYYEYSDASITPVVVDFGAGAGKVNLIALELGFPVSAAFELDESLVNLASQNYLKLSHRRKLRGKFFSFRGDATSVEDVARLQAEIRGCIGKDSTPILIAYNKNSYGAGSLKKSLMALDSNFSRYVYLYQNPVHKKVLEDLGLQVHRHIQDKGLRKNQDWLIATRD